VAVQKVGAAIPVKFADVTERVGISARPRSADIVVANFGPDGTGACFLDYDSDGNIDVFFADGGTRDGFMALYHNLGNGKFEDVTRASGLNPTLHANGCATGDYDNDGATDLAINAGGLLLFPRKNGTSKMSPLGIRCPLLEHVH
jgi:hypothetical protein